MRRALGVLLAAMATVALAQESEEPWLEYRSVLMFNQHLYYGTFARPRGVAYDREHAEVWVADSGNGLLGVYKTTGAELFSFSSKRYLRDPARVTIAPKGRIAVIEGDRSRVRLFNYRGNYLGDLQMTGVGDKPIIGAITYDSDGDAYVAENRSCQIFVYRPDGSVKQQFGSRGTDEGQFRSITAIVIGPDGVIYVADAQALAVQIFDPQGNFVRGWGRHEMGAENFSLPSGLAVDSKGRIFVADELRHQVKIFSADGKLLGQFGGLGEGPGQLAFPTDVTVDEKDRVYVAERQTARIQVFAPVSNN